MKNLYLQLTSEFDLWHLPVVLLKSLKRKEKYSVWVLGGVFCFSGGGKAKTYI